MYVFQEWPKAFYGPDGEVENFENAKAVPKDWKSHPRFFEKGVKQEPEPPVLDPPEPIDL